MKLRFYYRWVFVACLQGFVTLWLHAQELATPINIQSPNAAGLGRYGDVPVSYYTGAPNVSVPVYDVQVNGIPLDVSLSYDASGIRVDDHPGWVGQNWSLQGAGGVITRTVEGFPDEFGTVFPNRISYTEQTHSRIIDKFHLQDRDEMIAIADAKLTSNFEIIEYEPDIFTFNFMGISGKFFLANDGQWKVNSEHNLEVIHDYASPDFYARPFIEDIPGVETSKFDWVMYGFKMRDDQGNTYTFGFDQTAIEYSLPFWNQVRYSPYQNPAEISHWTANSWYLTKVEDKYNNTVYEFKYERGHFIAAFFKSNVSVEKRAKIASGFALQNYTWIGNGSQKSTSIDVLGSLISPVYLKEINTRQGHLLKFHRSVTTELEYSDPGLLVAYGKIAEEYQRINGGPFVPLYFIQSANPYAYDYQAALSNFIKGLRWSKLDEIEITRRNTLLRRVNFEYNNNPQQRLNLLKITCSGETLKNKFDYIFDYNNFDQLPGYLSERIDHWGYYRGSKNVLYSGERHEPVRFEHFNQYFGTRTPQPEFLQIGMLRSIVYPTGGRTEFEYEPHDYSRIVNDARNGFLEEAGIAGALRIKSITDFDGTNSIVRNFKYVKNYADGGTISSGILAFKPKYYWKDWTTITNYDQPYIESIFSTNTIIPLGNYFGTHIGYSEVTEVRADGSFTTHHFTSQEDYLDEAPYGTLNEQTSPYQKFTDRSYFRGNLKERSDYDNNKQLKRKVTYRYRHHFDVEGKYSVTTNAMWGYTSAPSNDQRFYRGEAWKIYYLDFDVVEEETTLFQAGQAVSEKTTYVKEDHFRPSNNIRLTKQINTNVSGDAMSTRFRYPIDLISYPEIRPLVDANRVGEVVWTETFRNGQNVGVKQTSYRAENSLYVPSSIKVSSTDHESVYEQTAFDRYDNKGNLLQYHSVDGIFTSVVWSYGTTMPSVIIKGATYTEVEQAFSSLGISIGDVNYAYHWSDDEFRSRIALLRSRLPNAQIKHYTYSVFGVSSETDANGQVTYYEYDDLGRLKLTRDFEGNILKRYTYQYK